MAVTTINEILTINYRNFAALKCCHFVLKLIVLGLTIVDDDDDDE